MAENYSLLIERASEVVDESRSELQKYIGSTALPIDYVTIYTKDKQDQAELNKIADEHGEKLFNKSGNLYRLENGLGEDYEFLLIGAPKQNNRKLGGVDFVISGHYQQVRGLIVTKTDHWHEEAYKRIRGKGDNPPRVDYSTIGVNDPESSVDLYFPSIRITDAIRRITNRN